MSQNTDLREALTAAGASPLVPKIISPILTELQRRYNPFIAAVPSMKWGSDSFYWNSRLSNPNGGFVIDGGARVVSNSSYQQNTFQMKHLQVVGAITGYAQNVATVNGDLRGLEIMGSIKGLNMDTENALIWGNAGATQFGAYPQFDGLDTQLNAYSGSGQNAIDYTSGANDANSVPGGLTLAVLDELADMVETNAAMDVFNSSWMFAMSNTAVSRIAQLLTNQQRFVDQVEVAAGLLVPSYRGIPLVKSSMLSTRSFAMGAVTATAAGTGGSLSAAATYYKVSAIFARGGESVASNEVTVTPTSGQNVTLAFTPPTGQDSLSAILYKVYRSSATGTESLIGVVDATVGLSADGITPIATTSIVDTGVTLIPQNGSTQPGTYPATYQGGNTSKKPPAKGREPIFLMSRDPNFICRPYVRESEPRDIFPTTSSPDSLPYALVTDTCLAVRAPRFIGMASGVAVSV